MGNAVAAADAAFVFFAFIIFIVVLHVSFMTALFEKCCCSHTKRMVFLTRFVLLLHILKVENLTHPIIVLSLARYVRKKQQQNLHHFNWID